ncbi:hypothetical protein D3C86_1523170 [compost metagenome]
MHHRELHAVDGEQFVKRESECLGSEHIDFHQRLTASIVAAQGTVALPVGGELSEEVLRQARVVTGPTILLKSGLPAVAPEVSVVSGEAVKCQGSQRSSSLHFHHRKLLPDKVQIASAGGFDKEICGQRRRKDRLIQQMLNAFEYGALHAVNMRLSRCCN